MSGRLLVQAAGTEAVPLGRADRAPVDRPARESGSRTMTAMVCACCDLEKPVTVALHCHPDISLCSDCLDWLVHRRDKQATIAGATRVVNDEPIFLVSNVARAKDHYLKLGFTTDEHDETYAFAHRDNVTLHLARADGRPIAGHVYLHVTDADELAADWRKAGLDVAGPEDYDYGKREGSHVDPDGNRIRFGSPLRHPSSS
jgi:catechol 2,3-dioxygenase-like lactoylglutathione lyase family enzyme